MLATHVNGTIRKDEMCRRWRTKDPGGRVLTVQVEKGQGTGDSAASD